MHVKKYSLDIVELLLAMELWYFTESNALLYSIKYSIMGRQ